MCIFEYNKENLVRKIPFHKFVISRGETALYLTFLFISFKKEFNPLTFRHGTVSKQFLTSKQLLWLILVLKKENKNSIVFHFTSFVMPMSGKISLPSCHNLKLLCVSINQWVFKMMVYKMIKLDVSLFFMNLKKQQ